MYPRLVADRLLDALQDSPVVLLHGPRQAGKTTLARALAEPRGYAYRTFDDSVLWEAAQTDPVGFVADLPDRVILDEVQRVPELFVPLKQTVDRDRRPGRFLLTGSANVLFLPALSDSLAGRIQIIHLHPLAQSELQGRPSRFLDHLWAGTFKPTATKRLGRNLADRIAAGGYPAALARPSPARRAAWYRDFQESLVARDAHDLARIRSLDVLPRLLAVAASQTARLFNLSELAAPFHLSRPTIREYVTLLERLFLLEELPPWHSNRLSRLIKTPKLHVGDTGLACAWLGADAAGLNADRALLGQLLETFVYQELRRQASGRTDDLRFYHYRDKDAAEVDIVIERGAQQVAGIEIKLTATVRAEDFRALRKLAAVCGSRFACGVVLYDGENLVRFGDRLFAIPLPLLWETNNQPKSAP